MSTKCLLFVLVIAFGAVSVFAQAAEPKIVVVELFTAEGCPRCPEAERGFDFMLRQQPVPGVEILPLALHVDYFDTDKSKDPYAQRLFTNRQEFYRSRFRLESAFTPQFVIDGAAQAMDSGRSTTLVIAAAREPKAAVTAKFTDGTLSVAIDSAPDHSDATVFVAIVTDRIEREIDGGVNNGRKFTHRAVVRDLSGIGKMAADSKAFRASVSPAIEREWGSEGLWAAIFVQENKSRKIIGAVKVLLEFSL